MKYAELIGNYKKQRIKSLYDNKIDVEYGTGLFAENGGRKNVPWRYKDDEGNWHSTSGQHPQPYMRPALNENREEILRILKDAIASTN